mmetsp:Transcript_14744/g.42459  ORF Transcript_14744/g.42459 Transcript_14744/m.42459 type:complete len:214 (-) Transcript_14744:1250-1891(-)
MSTAFAPLVMMMSSVVPVLFFSATASITHVMFASMLCRSSTIITICLAVPNLIVINPSAIFTFLIIASLTAFGSMINVLATFEFCFHPTARSIGAAVIIVFKYLPMIRRCHRRLSILNFYLFLQASFGHSCCQRIIGDTYIKATGSGSAAVRLIGLAFALQNLAPKQAQLLQRILFVPRFVLTTRTTRSATLEICSPSSFNGTDSSLFLRLMV